MPPKPPKEPPPSCEDAYNELLRQAVTEKVELDRANLTIADLRAELVSTNATLAQAQYDLGKRP